MGYRGKEVSLASLPQNLVNSRTSQLYQHQHVKVQESFFIFLTIIIWNVDAYTGGCSEVVGGNTELVGGNTFAIGHDNTPFYILSLRVYVIMTILSDILQSRVMM